MSQERSSPFPQHRLSGGSLSSPTINPVTEKPFHYTYLKEFRVEQCKAFLQHKCNQHRPFTCFHWHFMNQRRRRPIKRRDGTFNYSPDVYCTLYDETTGLCPNGDDCPYLHRTAGDTERRYHLRYYKTSTCVYETDSRGYCVKNGPHCAFAHGPHDLRPPVYDIRELQGGDDEDRLVSPLVGSLEKERGVLVDDPRWQESSFVLTYYKTEPCKRPPRLCRQGYACPFYHNNKDRRRTPKSFKYRSTPCPNVKLNDEWGDPAHCDQGNGCCYCHTRTEQQFHPEIYKSTKCNDVQQTGYCPRGPFCAFAHDEKELTAPRELTDEPMATAPSPIMTTSSLLESVVQPHSIPFSSSLGHSTSSPHIKSLPKPIGRPDRSGSTSSEGFQKAPGAEVKSRSLEEEGQMYIRKQIQAIENDTSLDESERTRRKQNLLKLSLGSSSSGMSPEAVIQPHSLPSSVSDALEAMVGGGLDDLTLEDIESSNTNLADDASESQMYMPGQSPVAQGFLHSFHSQHSSSSYPYSTPLGPLSPYGTPPVAPGANLSSNSSGPFQHVQTVGPGVGFTPTSPLPSSSSPSPFGPSFHQQQRYTMAQVITQQTQSRPPASPTKGSSMMQAALGSPREQTERAALKEELRQARTLMASWNDSWKQAKHACDAWKREAEEATNKLKTERELSSRRIDELERRLRDTEGKLAALQAQGPVRTLAEGVEIGRLPMSTLEQIQHQLRFDLERIETNIRHRATLCTQCKEFPRCVFTKPCNHCVLCEACADKLGSDAVCPYCNERITQRSTVILPF